MAGSAAGWAGWMSLLEDIQGKDGWKRLLWNLQGSLQAQTDVDHNNVHHHHAASSFFFLLMLLWSQEQDVLDDNALVGGAYTGSRPVLMLYLFLYLKTCFYTFWNEKIFLQLVTNDTKVTPNMKFVECQASTFGVDSMKIYFSCFFLQQISHLSKQSSAGKTAAGPENPVQLAPKRENGLTWTEKWFTDRQIDFIQSTCLCLQAEFQTFSNKLMKKLEILKIKFECLIGAEVTRQQWHWIQESVYTTFSCFTNQPPELKRPVKTQCHAWVRSALVYGGQRSARGPSCVLAFPEDDEGPGRLCLFGARRDIRPHPGQSGRSPDTDNKIFFFLGLLMNVLYLSVEKCPGRPPSETCR